MRLLKKLPADAGGKPERGPAGQACEIWFQDEARVGQKNGQVYQWATKGTRPRQAADQRYESAHIFGAVCPALDKGAALVMPHANTEAMQKHLDEISTSIAANAHGVVIMDGAGWHKSAALNIPPPTRGAIVKRITEIGSKTWKIEAGYHRRSLAETAMYRAMTLISPTLNSRTLLNQKTEAAIAVNCINRFTALGMPVSVKIV